MFTTPSPSMTLTPASSTAQIWRSDLEEDEDELVGGYYLPAFSPANGLQSANDSSASVTPISEFAFRPCNASVDIPSSTLIQPISQFQSQEDHVRRFPELKAVAELLSAQAAQKRAIAGHLEGSDDELGSSGFDEIVLDDFSVYMNSANYHWELRPLHHLATKSASDIFYLDGLLRAGGLERRVTRVPFDELPIGNYGVEGATVGDDIWIRSQLNKKREVYYRLGNPAAEYRRFFTPFRWIADLAKHFVDYCNDAVARERRVVLEDFRAAFSQWLARTHRGSKAVSQWRQQHGRSSDFRTSVAANVAYLWKEAYGVLNAKSFTFLVIFQEIRSFTQYRLQTAPALKSQIVRQWGSQVAATIVTPYIYDCFGHMRLGKVLKAVKPVTRVMGNLNNGTKKGAVSDESMSVDELRLSPEKPPAPLTQDVINSIQPGDTISTHPDAPTTGTKWKSRPGSLQESRWFALVQKVWVSARSELKSFDVIWLYQPGDTPCGGGRYPWSNELFLSNHCTCEDGRSARIDQDEILGVHSVDWHGEPGTACEFFVRQTYLTEERRWVTLRESHRNCPHVRERGHPFDDDLWQPKLYLAGDTVLAAIGQGDNLLVEPYEIVELVNDKQMLLRHLLRRQVVDPQALARPNELVYSERRSLIQVSAIVNKCIVRIFKPNQAIPTPYDRDGTGNVFFMTHREHLLESGERQILPLDGPPSTLRKGYDPAQRVPKLRALDLFCGSGNFGRGLEDGGAIEFQWANDIWDKAMHTYMANAPGKVSPFLGSVDDLLFKALSGEYSDSVPKPGDVDFIAGGSPCQGFSRLTMDKTSLRQVKNRSMVASFASFVDLYRPKFGVLENVLSMIRNGERRGKDEDNDNVFAHLMCAVVGMGYQAQVIMGDAWRHGAPQQRSRIFLYFAASGLRLPEPPAHSHSHPEDAKERTIGRMSNGEPFFVREFTPTPFRFVSAGEATADLPDIIDGKVDTCIPFPDHRVSMGMTPLRRNQAAAIPIRPPGMNFARTWNRGQGRMSPAQRALFPATGPRVAANSRAWGRIEPGALFSTVATVAGMSDARMGRLLHWRETRVVTVQEVRRAQGFRDHELLLGSPFDQWRLVGNSVARQMALALGLSFREAWVGSLFDDGATEKINMPVRGTGSKRQPEASPSMREERYTKGAGASACESTPESATPATAADFESPAIEIRGPNDVMPARKRPAHDTMAGHGNKRWAGQSARFPVVIE